MTLLRHATLIDGRLADVRIDGTDIGTVGPAGGLPWRHGEQEIDLTGYLLLPAPVEAHAHLDKCFSIGRADRRPVGLAGAIELYRQLKKDMDVPDVLARARAGIRQSVASGVTAIRSHVDVGEVIGLRGLEALIAVRDELLDVLPLQIVALASCPVTGREGAENRALLAAAMDRGADLVGGVPHIDTDPTGALEFCLQTAADVGKPIDLHMDETLDDAMLSLSDLAAMARGFPQPVTASHCVSLGVQPLHIQRQVAEALAEAEVFVVTLPQSNLYLQAQGRVTAPPRGLTAVRTLLEAGVTVASGSDNVQDVFNPVGRGDPIATAWLLVAAVHLSPEAAYGTVSSAGRRALGLATTQVGPGDRADLLAIAGNSVTEALASGTEDRMVFCGGALVARTTVERQLHLPAPGSDRC
jgi:cytosine/creatinine deaminase